MEQLVSFLGPGKTFCAHAPGAVEPLGSAMKYFRSEFEAGVKAPMTITSCSRVSSPTCWASAGKRQDAFRAIADFIKQVSGKLYGNHSCRR
ncbi:hypothetical protein ACLK13_12120 [Escherichia coli]